MNLSKTILEYYEWLESVNKSVGDHTMLVSLNPDDESIIRNTDELRVRGFYLKGQDIEVSRITGNVFITPSLLTFAKWLEQYEQYEKSMEHGDS